MALSTRNNLLSKKSYTKVALITNYLLKFKYNKKKLQELKQVIKKLENIYKIKIDYLEFRNEKDLSIYNFKKKNRLFIAYIIDKIRLIDNF